MKALKKLLSGIKNTFNIGHPKKRQVYAVTGGKYLGEFFIYIEQREGDLLFLSLPSMERRAVPSDKFEFAIANKILDPVENLSKDMYKLCKEQYKSINN